MKKRGFYRNNIPTTSVPSPKGNSGKLLLYTNGKEDRPLLRELVDFENIPPPFAKNKITLPPGKTELGNVLFVSKEGDNNTAVKGDTHKPWDHPLEAKAAAQPGDLIVVFPGVYTASNSDTSADFIGNSTTLNMMGEDLTYYLFPGVEIEHHSTSAEAMFRGRVNGTIHDTKVYGEGILRLKNSIRFIDCRNEPNKLHIECHGIEADSVSASAWGNSDYMDYLYIKADYFTRSSGTSSWLETPRYDNAYMYIDIGQADFGIVLSVTDYTGSSVTASNVTRIEKYGTFTADIRTNYFYDFRNTNLTDSHLEFTVDKMVITSGASPYDEFFRCNTASTWTNTQFRVHIGDGVFESAFYRDLGTAQNCDATSGLYFTGKYYFTGFSNALNVEGGFEFTYGNQKVYMDCDVSVVDNRAIRTEGSINTLDISGVYRRTTDGPLIGITVAFSNMFLKNCTLINTGVTQTISAPAGTTITTARLYTSNSAQDADITFNQLHEPT